MVKRLSGSILRAMAIARAFWTVEAGKGELRAEELAPPESGQLLIETCYSGISRGTESLVFHGRVPSSEWRRLRAPYQSGEFPFPVKYGYSNVGRVVAGDAARVGKLVFTLYPHQERFVVPAEAARPVPPGVPAQRAILAANMETALNAMWDALPRLGDRITVVGAGVVGCLVAALSSRLPGADVELVDVLDERAHIASALGARFRLPDAASTQRDLVFHTSAHEGGLRRCLELARPDGKVVEMSWYGSRDITLNLGGVFHSQRLQLCCSQVGRVSPNKPDVSFTQRLDLALELLNDSRLDVLLGRCVEFDELPEHLPDLLGSVPPGPPALSVRYRVS